MKGIEIKIQGKKVYAFVDLRVEYSLISTALLEELEYEVISQEFYFSIQDKDFNYSMRLVDEDESLFVLLRIRMGKFRK